jgi:hypothetical protein
MDLEGSNLGIGGYIPEFAGGAEKNLNKIRIAGHLAEIRTEYDCIALRLSVQRTARCVFM